MGYPKYRVLIAAPHVTAEKVVEMPDAKMFGGGALVGDGTNQVDIDVYTGPTADGPWSLIFCLITQYAGMAMLAPIPCGRWIKLIPGGTGATFTPYVCLE